MFHGESVVKLWKYLLPWASGRFLPRRFVLVRQEDQSDCAAAALAMVALHYQVPMGVQAIRQLAGTDRRGTNLSGLSVAAENLGFTARPVKGPYEALADIQLPAIAHCVTEEGHGHFVVIFDVRKGGVTVGDPAKGILRLTEVQFCQQWTGNLLLVTPDESRPLHAGDGEPKTPWRRYLGLLAKHKPVLGEAFCASLLLTLLGISTSFFVQQLVDSVLVRNEGRLLNALGIGMVLVVLFRAGFNSSRQYLLAHLGRKVDLALVSAYVRHVLKLPMSFFETRRVGEIISRVNDAAKVRQGVSGASLTVLLDGVMVVLSMFVLWFYDARLAGMATAFVPLVIIAVISHHPAINQRSREAMEQSAQLSAHLVEDLHGVQTIKAFNMEQARADEGEMRLLRVVQSVFSLQKLGLSMGNASLVITGLAATALLWYGGHRVMSQALTVGELLFCSTLLGYLLAPLERLATVNLEIQDALVALDRLSQILELKTEDDRALRRATFDQLGQLIEFKDVSFHYGHWANVLDGINLRIPAGSTLGIVGESGSGKSTLIKLMMRFYDPSEGQIILDGQDYRNFELASLRGKIGLVSQDAFVFNGTVAQNIAVGKPQATVEEVIAAARIAGLEEFVNNLPQRYETMVGEQGANLSGGERQRVAIARALLHKPEIVIFDEATSHLDTATEKAIQESLKSALAGKTVLLVAHRLSTVKDMDTICVLHAGRIVEQGSHSELTARNGHYAALWRAQTADQSSRLSPAGQTVTLDRLSINSGNGRTNTCTAK